ncbi:hypothetical protein ASE61_15100 [Bosea sp. Root670]|uniref:hypothetical protein n=1 Tax=Bosea sp. Root670 TaxID=1736583 RepID=UPI00071538E5|nr:hypothetical protein [Bosea sp. Root670]KRE02602.1 hypothetical protein ASE61_15100 [Bosea sp. Root670]
MLCGSCLGEFAITELRRYPLLSEAVIVLESEVDGTNDFSEMMDAGVKDFVIVAEISVAPYGVIS